MEGLTSFGLAGSCVRTQGVAIGTAARIGPIRVHTGLATNPINAAFIVVYRQGDKFEGEFKLDLNP